MQQTYDQTDSAAPVAFAPDRPVPEFTQIEFPPLVLEPLSPEWSLGVAAQHIVLTHFAEMLSWRAGVWRNTDIEAVHQIRVSARRCRTALQTFAALWPDRLAKKFGDYIARFADAFGTSRDLDVMLLWLGEQLQTADSDRAAAYRWLLKRNQARRAQEQPALERTLLKLEQDGLPAAFVAYFSRLPLDLWEFSPITAAESSGEPVHG